MTLCGVTRAELREGGIYVLVGSRWRARAPGKRLQVRHHYVRQTVTIEISNTSVSSTSRTS